MNANTTPDPMILVMSATIADHRLDMMIGGQAGMMTGVMMTVVTMTGAMMTVVMTIAATTIAVMMNAAMMTVATKVDENLRSPSARTTQKVPNHMFSGFCSTNFDFLRPQSAPFSNISTRSPSVSTCIATK
jgi:hypothetical protein